MAVFPAVRETRAAAPSLLDSIVIIRCRTDEAEGLSKINEDLRFFVFGVSSVVLAPARTSGELGTLVRDQEVGTRTSRVSQKSSTVHCTLYMYMYYVVHVGPTGTVDLFEASSLTPL